MENNNMDFVKNEGIDVDGLDAEEVVDETVNELVEEQNEAVDETIDDISEAMENEEKADEDAEEHTAFVTGCLRLNVRKEPSKASEVIEVVNVNDELVIGYGFEDEEWANVKTPSGAVGYCMKQYLAVKAEQ